jgi:undecaprenyl-diphosphatase
VHRARRGLPRRPAASSGAGLRAALLAGLLQGPAELLPVSSSAHVALAARALGWGAGAERKELEVAAHAGSALALAVTGPWPRPAFAAVSVAPAALAGLALERPVEERLGTPSALAAGLLAGSAWLLAAGRAGGRRGRGDARLGDAAWLGVAQAAALAPGVSRAGATLAAARLRGFTPAAAGALSREAALPVLAGASALKALRVAQRRPPRAVLARLALAASAAAVSTAAALRLAPATARVPPVAWAAYRAALAAALLATAA